MIYNDNSFGCNNPAGSLSLISQVKDAVNYGRTVIYDLFFRVFSSQDQLEIPARSLESSLNAVRLDADLQAFKKDWRWVASTNARIEQSKKIDAEYKKIMKTHSPSLINIEHHHFFEDLGLYSGMSSLWMPGMGVIAAHLSEKKGLKNLFACAMRCRQKVGQKNEGNKKFS